MIREQRERVQFDLSSEALQRLDEIKAETGASTRAEVMRNALRVYDWFISEVEPDNIIKVLNEDEVTIARFRAKLLVN